MNNNVIGFNNFECGKKSSAIGGTVGTVTPENGKSKNLTVLMFPGGGMPFIKTGDILFIPHVEAAYLKTCKEKGLIVEVGIYKGDKDGIAQIEWRAELVEYAAKHLYHKPVNICDSDFFPCLMRLAKK